MPWQPQPASLASLPTWALPAIIGGVVAPDITDVIMVRKPPQPGGAAPKPGAAQ